MIDAVLVGALLCVAGPLLDRVLRQMKLRGRGRAWTDLRGVSFGAGALAVVTSRVGWSDLSFGYPLPVGMLLIVFGLTWKAVSDDFDLGLPDEPGGPRAPERGLLVATAAAALVWPSALFVWLTLLLHVFGGWKHHTFVPLRIIYVLLAGLGVAAPLAGSVLSPEAMEGGLWLASATMLSSHYLVAALAKAELGSSPWEWAKSNRLHMLVGSSWAWGWRGRRDWAAARGLMRRLEPLDVPLQIGTFLLELAAPLVVLHPLLCFALLGALVAMHLTIFFTAGILFWEWILACVAFATWTGGVLAAGLSLPFGLLPALACLAIIAVGPAKKRLWHPAWLGWWDTPFIQRVDWVVTAESGARYGLYNDFMSPHEGEYGRAFGWFLVPHRICTYHLGEVWDAELRDMLWEAREDRSLLEQAKLKHGTVYLDEAETRAHLDYLELLFVRFNEGRKKHVLPAAVAWAKAPGAQYYYWGDLPAFRGQERVAAIEIFYREALVTETGPERTLYERLHRIELGATATPDTSEDGVAEPAT